MMQYLVYAVTIFTVALICALSLHFAKAEDVPRVTPIPPGPMEECYRQGGIEFHFGYVGGTQTITCVFKR